MLRFLRKNRDNRGFRRALDLSKGFVYRGAGSCEVPRSIHGHRVQFHAPELCGHTDYGLWLYDEGVQFLIIELLYQRKFCSYEIGISDV